MFYLSWYNMTSLKNKVGPVGNTHVGPVGNTHVNITLHVISMLHIHAYTIYVIEYISTVTIDWSSYELYNKDCFELMLI